MTLMNQAPAWALEDDGETEIAENIISLYGNACEKFKAEEAKSSVRERATDKASFKAVENIPELSNYRKSGNAHDFNVIVYNLVDNFVEDLTVRTTEQDETKLCVEVTGYLNIDNILQVLNDNAVKKQEIAEENPVKQEELDQPLQYPDQLVLESKKDALKATITDFPPKPDIKINEAIAAENIENTDNGKTKQAMVAENAVKLHLLPTKFYNGASTKSYLDILQTLIEEESNLEIIDQAYGADYLIKSEVLRAKVEPINKQTNRLQMVVSITLEDTSNNTSITEHQNRFVLFENGEDEQMEASKLMKKLLKKAGEQIIQRLHQTAKAKKNLTGIITPTSSTYNQKLPQAQ